MTKSNRPLFHLVPAFGAALLLALFASPPVRAEIHCAGGHCTCSGDKDCNTMFTSLCKDTGGSCNDDNNTCTCTQKLKAATGLGGKKQLPNVAPANKTLKKY